MAGGISVCCCPESQKSLPDLLQLFALLFNFIFFPVRMSTLNEQDDQENCQQLHPVFHPNSVNGSGSLLYKERLKELSLYNLEKRFRGSFNTIQVFKGAHKENGGSLSTMSHVKRQEVMRPVNSQGHTNWIRGKFFSMRTINHQNNLPWEGVVSLMLDNFKIQLDRVLVQGHLAQKMLLLRKVGPNDS